jgi:hypothetical protein
VRGEKGAPYPSRGCPVCPICHECVLHPLFLCLSYFPPSPAASHLCVNGLLAHTALAPSTTELRMDKATRTGLVGAGRHSLADDPIPSDMTRVTGPSPSLDDTQTRPEWGPRRPATRRLGVYRTLQVRSGGDERDRSGLVSRVKAACEWVVARARGGLFSGAGSRGGPDMASPFLVVFVSFVRRWRWMTC